MSDASTAGDITQARKSFPATHTTAYFNTAAVGLASSALSAAYHQYIDEWTERGLDSTEGYGVRQVPFRNGGLESDDVARRHRPPGESAQ